MTSFRGAFTALVTPFTDDGGAIDFDRLREQVQLQIDGGVSGVVPCGTTGEAPTLADDEHRAVIEQVTVQARGAGLQVIAGAGSYDTRHAIAMHRFAESCGCHGSLQVTPYYNKPSQEGLYRHFASIADSGELPVVLYNIPGRTGVALTAATIHRLAEHPNIVAVKDATGSLDLANEILSGTEIDVLSGDDPLTVPLASIGGCGAISVVSNVLPRQVAAMCRAMLEGDLGAARALHGELLPLSRALLQLDSNPVPVKTLMHLLGRDAGSLRPPLCRPPDRVVGVLQRHADELRTGVAHVTSSA